jgi:hypothetical protein
MGNVRFPCMRTYETASPCPLYIYSCGLNFMRASFFRYEFPFLACHYVYGRTDRATTTKTTPSDDVNGSSYSLSDLFTVGLPFLRVIIYTLSTKTLSERHHPEETLTVLYIQA